MKRFIILIQVFIASTLTLLAYNIDVDYERVISLKGEWKFMIGDNMKWAGSEHNVSDWENIYAPSTWEDQGFPGYDGHAWYRKDVVIPENLNGFSLVLYLGYIDDVDEVFLNGVKIGKKGSFPPNYWTAYNTERKYIIPSDIIKFNQKNTIAVRVYDSQLQGGIVKGDIGIYTSKNDLPMEVRLEGQWKFRLGDNFAWKQSGLDDGDWRTIIVPGYWEDQVANYYDGFAWYRKTFKAPASMSGNRYVLLLGKIDDLDQVYLNGKLVGGTGFSTENKVSPNGNEHSYDRFYYLNAEDIKPGAINTIAVRVYDRGGEGGIYSGAIGLVNLKDFVAYWRKKQ
ncbi:MAG: hypothetical protein JXA77_04330 [Bacteroidales bacterium]|nr:hypothetical protein [Bacteroidales bacterium]MBN2819781.1 hypothetical protein [Bacteroidales bacterium]